MTHDTLASHQLLSDSEFLQQFEDASLDPSLFKHVGHLRGAFLFLQREPMLLAQRHFTQTLQRYAAALGAPDKFHATVTYALLAIMSARQGVQQCANWREFLQKNPDLTQDASKLLSQYYHPETLESEQARKTFVLPDKASLASMIAGADIASSTN